MKLYDMQTQPALSQYTGCGKAGVAMKDDRIIAIRYMDDHTGCFTGYSPEALKRANRKRYCKASELAARELNRERFSEWRIRARRELNGLGDVVSGMMSCWRFNPNPSN